MSIKLLLTIRAIVDYKVKGCIMKQSESYKRGKRYGCIIADDCGFDIAMRDREYYCHGKSDEFYYGFIAGVEEIRKRG